MKAGTYHRSVGDLRHRLAAAIPHDQIKMLHQKTPFRHFAVAFRQALLFSVAFFLGWTFDSLWIRLPAALVLGLVVFDGTVLLHEVVHRAVFPENHPMADRVLGILYALPSGISASQFTRWHLDHHAELGSSRDDPKRAHLSPKTNSRWLKLLYATPALFPIYFRAAAIETATYPDSLRRRIAVERAAAVLLHISAATAIGVLGGWLRFVWLYLIPVFFVFPPAFALNRLGQHYDIDPGNPARWSTRMSRSRFWSAVYLWSNYHLEHHYFPAFPFYRLPELSASLEPFFTREGIPSRTYRELLFDWLVRNRPPHSAWSIPTEGTRASE